MSSKPSKVSVVKNLRKIFADLECLGLDIYCNKGGMEMSREKFAFLESSWFCVSGFRGSFKIAAGGDTQQGLLEM